MGWITLTLVASALLVLFYLTVVRSTQSRRRHRLEAAFFRAKGSRLVSNGFMPGR